jgi:hypothetical protein
VILSKTANVPKGNGLHPVAEKRRFLQTKRYSQSVQFTNTRSGANFTLRS